MCATEMQQILTELYQDRANPNAQSVDFYLSKMHILAENQYPPALPFFLEGLEDPRWDWRQDCLRSIGFHYLFSPDSAIAERIRAVLRDDSSEEVRITAALVLGGRSKWPDPTLFDALQKDPSRHVRSAAFEAILELFDVPFFIIMKKGEAVDSYQLEPTWDEIQKIVAAYGTPPHQTSPSTEE